MKKLAIVVVFLGLAACSKHKCDLSSGSDKETFGDVAPMTGGAFSCFVSNGELVASHGDTTVDAITTKYQAFLEKDGWKVSVEEKTGQRSNGKSYQGKTVTADKGGKKVTTLVYPLTDKLIESVTTVK
jgi:hypothetical protein